MTPTEVARVLARDEGAGLKEFLKRQRWFAAKARGIDTVRVAELAVLDGAGPLLLALLDVDGERYYLPLAVAEPTGNEDAIVRAGSRAVVDAHADPGFGRRLLEAIGAGRDIAGRAGRFSCRPMRPWAGPSGPEAATIATRRIAGEQSNTSIVLGGDLILKSLRRPRAGVSPEVETLRFLAERTSFRHAPRLAGWMDYAGPAGDPATVSVLQGFVDHSGDGWRHVVLALGRACAARACPPSGAPGSPGARAGGDALMADVWELGAVTGQLHAALAADGTVPAFAPEPIAVEDARRWTSQIASTIERVASGLPVGAGPSLARALRGATDGGGGSAWIADALDRLAAVGAHKIRCHGDYHLGQVLKTAATFVVIDFEGEPGRPLAERRAKQSPLRDVAGMLRSFNYAVNTVLREREPAERARVTAWLEDWERRARDTFLDGYTHALAGCPVRLVPPSRDDLRRACAAFEIDKACYELAYELANRPDWVAIPLAGLARLLEPARYS